MFSNDNSLVAMINGTNTRVTVKSSLKGPLNESDNYVFSFSSPVQNIKFSPDCTMLLAVMAKSNVVEARSLQEEDWKARIEDSAAGIVNAIWSPDSRHILSFSDF